VVKDTMVQKSEKLKHTFLQEQKMEKLKRLKNDKPKKDYAGNPNWAGDD